MEWFTGLRRSTRFFICFLLPIGVAGVLYAFLYFLVGSIVLLAMYFVLLPIFIGAEQRIEDRKHDEIVQYLDMIARQGERRSAPQKKRNGVLPPPPEARAEALPERESKQAAPAPSAAAQREEAKEKPRASAPSVAEQLGRAARSRAQALIDAGNAEHIRRRIDELDRQLPPGSASAAYDPAREDLSAIERALWLERDLLMKSFKK